MNPLSIDWRTIRDNWRSDPRPVAEWWYALDPKHDDDQRTLDVRRSIERYEARWGCPPVDLPRVVTIGSTPMLAYAIPAKEPAPIIEEPPPVIIEEPTEHIMQLMLL